MKLLVTGGAGYIGSVCVRLLLDEGHQVVVVDDLSTGNVSAVAPGAEFIQDDFVSAARDLLPGGSFDGVLHFAAKALVGESVASPELYWIANLVKSLELLEVMRIAGTPRLIFSSTAATYGEPQSVPITEDSSTRPTNPYGATKLAVDQAIASYSEAHGLAATSLRYFNVAGAYGGLGERHGVETHLIPLILQVATGQRAEIMVYGNDWPTPDGTCIRDYIHVRDLADAHLLALRNAKPGTHRICNLGNGTGFSVREVIECCRRITGHPIPSRDVPRRPGDPAVLIASSEKAVTELGWAPRHNRLEEIVETAWAFAQLHLET